MGVVRHDLLLVRLGMYITRLGDHGQLLAGVVDHGQLLEGGVRHELLLARLGLYTTRLGLYAMNYCWLGWGCIPR